MAHQKNYRSVDVLAYCEENIAGYGAENIWA
jgi:hypothetical protein